MSKEGDTNTIEMENEIFVYLSSAGLQDENKRRIHLQG